MPHAVSANLLCTSLGRACHDEAWVVLIQSIDRTQDWFPPQVAIAEGLLKDGDPYTITPQIP
jgi:hypothetical protein